MPDRTNVIYLYDGTIEGLYTCIFEAFEKKETPFHILPQEPEQISFLPCREIETDFVKAGRVSLSIPKRISAEAADFIQLSFLTCLADKEIYLLDLLRKGFRTGGRILDCLSDDTVDRLTKAVHHLTHEAHLLKGFLRFSSVNGILVSTIAPKNLVLPLLREHFCDRYPQESFFIYDKTHGMALAYQPYQSKILPVDSFSPEPINGEELRYQKLWRSYYDTVAIQERYNPKCRMSHMPKRYWDYMTEFQGASKACPEFGKSPGSLRLEPYSFDGLKADTLSQNDKPGLK